MREIKFRGKRIDNGEWVFGSFISDALEGSNSDLISWGFIRRYNRGVDKMETIEVDRETVGQYTGLKDKNGTEIYEGDIVNMHYFFENYNRGTFGAFEDEKEVVGVIRIDEISVYTDCNGRRLDWVNFLEEPTEELEVIGNIHDNPELLGGAE